jgi:hypothetical protein
MRHIFNLLPNLTTVIFSLPQPTRAFTRSHGQRAEALRWVLDQVPPEAALRWGAWGGDAPVEPADPLNSEVVASRMKRHLAEVEAMNLRSILEERGPLISCPSIAAQLEATKRKVSRIGPWSHPHPIFIIHTWSILEMLTMNCIVKQNIITPNPLQDASETVQCAVQQPS